MEEKINQTLVLELFRTEGFIVLNKKAIKILGLVPAVVLGSYLERYSYFVKNHPENDGWFFSVHQQMLEELNIGIAVLRKAKSELIEKGIIKTELRGIPPKEWINIDFDTLTISVIKSDHKGSDSRININNNKNNNNIPSKPSVSPVEEEDLSEKHITLSMFELFWKAYPKKIDKGKALTSWKKLCNKSPKEKPLWRVLRRAIQQQKQTERWGDPKFIPHASTWLNQSRWLDDPKEMKNIQFGDNPNTKGKPSFIHDDGIRYDLRDDGYYYHCVSGERYIP